MTHAANVYSPLGEIRSTAECPKARVHWQSEEEPSPVKRKFAAQRYAGMDSLSCYPSQQRIVKIAGHGCGRGVRAASNLRRCKPRRCGLGGSRHTAPHPTRDEID